MAEPISELPAFDRPPVSETALGVEFQPVPGWGVPHFGLFWSEIRSEYPRFEVQPPLASQIERFGSEPQVSPSLIVEFSDAGRSRCWFFHENNARLLQVQDSRFILNWRKLTDNAEYPHYSRFRPQFAIEWTRFTDCVARFGLPPPAVEQCEVTYTNFFPRGEGWHDYSEFQLVIPAWAGKHSWLPSAEYVVIGTRYVFPENAGRFHVSLQPVVRNTDAVEGLQLTLTARGRPTAPDLEGILRWFDLGHEWIVRGFADLTSSHMHKHWGRTA